MTDPTAAAASSTPGQSPSGDGSAPVGSAPVGSAGDGSGLNADAIALRTGRKLRLRAILMVAATALITILASTQLWWTVQIPDKGLDVSGTVASPALSALSLSALALAAALGIAGPVFRVILGVLQVFIGGTIVLATITSLANPADASASLISTATGVAGVQSLDSLVEGISFTAWPWVALVGGVLSLLVGVFILATFRRWPGPSRKYSAVRVEDPSAPRDSVGDWDALSDGSDPTDR